jgi:hypothetical protein
LDAEPSAPIVTWGHLILRASIGVMIFYIHGLHKLEGGLAYLQHGTPWTLLKEVAEMHFPAPVVSAFAATFLQFLCSPLVALGLFTRLNAARGHSALPFCKTFSPGGIHNWRSFTSSFCLALFFLVAAGFHLMLPSLPIWDVGIPGMDDVEWQRRLAAEKYPHADHFHHCSGEAR